MNYLNERIENDILIVEFTVATILDSLAVDSVWQELNDRVGRADRSRVVIDFSSVEFVSSGLLGVLLTLRSMGQAKGFSLKLCGLTKGMKKIFSVTELDGLFKTYRTQRSAIESYGAESFVVRHEFFTRFDAARKSKSDVAAQNPVAVPVKSIASLAASPHFYLELEQAQR